MIHKTLKIAGIILIIFVLLFIILATVYYPAAKKLYLGNEVIHSDSALTIYLGGGGNSVVLNTDTALLVVDTKFGKAADRLYKTISAQAGNKPIIVVNTHSDLDHTGGNPLYKNARIISGQVHEDYWVSANKGKEGMPSVWVNDTLNLRLGDENVLLISMGQAHTWCDVVVYFPNRDLLVTGDLVFNGINTFFEEKKGSNGSKSVEALKKLETFPEVQMVVPGHGAPGGRELITNMRTYLEDMSLAAENPEKEKAIRKKYRKLVAMPGVSSTAIVIDYFRKNPNDL
jgi:glyoxylase-like metal-dependent hydrolase (beta-lactamase superfamily II)